jgi:hypothetical protein
MAIADKSASFPKADQNARFPRIIAKGASSLPASRLKKLLPSILKRCFRCIGVVTKTHWCNVWSVLALLAQQDS